MLPELALLSDLQEIDREILELKRQMSSYPTLWEKTKAKVQRARNEHDAAKDAHARHHENRKRIETSLIEQTNMLRRVQLQQPMIKTQKEFEAHTKQLEGIRMRVASLEAEGLDELNREATLKEAIASSVQKAKELEKAAVAEKERIRTLMTEKKAAVAQLEKARDKSWARLDKKFQTEYERAARKWPGSAIATVRKIESADKKEKNAVHCCTGCNFQMLNHKLVEVHRGDKINICDNCGRILSHDEDYAPAEESAAF